MKYFMISIIMWWANPEDIPFPYNDSVEIQTYMDEPLHFKTLQECYQHVDENLENLKEFGRYYYPSANAVSQILCIEKYMTET